MPRYIAIEPLKHNDKPIANGEPVEMDSKEGAALEARGIVRQDKSTPAPPALTGTDKHPAKIKIHNKNHSLGEIVAVAHKASGLSVEDWNAQDQAARDAAIDKTIAELQAAPK